VIELEIFEIDPVGLLHHQLDERVQWSLSLVLCARELRPLKGVEQDEPGATRVDAVGDSELESVESKHAAFVGDRHVEWASSSQRRYDRNVVEVCSRGHGQYTRSRTHRPTEWIASLADDHSSVLQGNRDSLAAPLATGKLDTPRRSAWRSNRDLDRTLERRRFSDPARVRCGDNIPVGC